MTRHWALQDISGNESDESEFVAGHRPHKLPEKRFVGAPLEAAHHRQDSSNSEQVESFAGIGWTGSALFGPWCEWRGL